MHVPEDYEVHPAQRRSSPAPAIPIREEFSARYPARFSAGCTAKCPASSWPKRALPPSMLTSMLKWLRAVMRLLDRYIGREVASHSLLGLAVFTFVFFVPQLVRLMELIVRHSGGISTVLLLFLCTLPPVLIFTIPMAVLVGVLIGLGRLSSDSEIVALHASGVGLRRLLVPVGGVALASAVAALVITFWLSPLSLRTLRRLEVKILASQASFEVQPRV